ncbi:MAG: cytochrome P450 [Rhizobiaceae bacterium]
MSALPDSFAFAPGTRRLRLDPRDPGFFRDPWPAYAALHAEGGVFCWAQQNLWCFGRHDDVNRLLRDRRLGRENRWGAPLNPAPGRAHLAAFDRVESGSILEREPPSHTRLRSLLTRAFVSRQVEKLKPRIERLAGTLVDGFPAGRAFDLMPSFATPIPLTIICDLLGVPLDKGDELLRWSHAMCEMYVADRAHETELAADRASADFAAYVRAVVADRKRALGEDLISALINARDAGEKLDDDELVSTCVLLLNAGHEATVHQTGNAVKTLIEQGGDPRRFFADEATAEASVEECLRFDPPLHMFTRYVYETFEPVPGVSVEPGQSIGLLLGMANRDPLCFEAPDEFRPGRPDQKNVTFGAGIHFCIGAPLARLELQTGLKVLFDRCPGLALAEPPRYRNSWHFHGLERLEVTV